MSFHCKDKVCGAVDCADCHPELQEKRTCPCCGEAVALWAMSAVYCGGCGDLICGECVHTAQKIDGKEHCPACAKKLQAELERDKALNHWRSLGYTEECIFEGEYRLLTNPKNLNKVRVYDNGDVWVADPKTGVYDKAKWHVEIVGNSAEGLVFEAAMKKMICVVHANARAHGWHDKPVEDGTLIALIHSEASEALDALRHGNPPSEHVPAFSGVEEELADIVIRCMDMAGRNGYRLGEAIAAKHEFNKGRPHMHGNKLF